MISILFSILFYFNFILLIHSIIVQIEYDFWYAIVIIDFLQVIHMTIRFQIIPCIGKYEFYDRLNFILFLMCLGDSTDRLSLL